MEPSKYEWEQKATLWILARIAARKKEDRRRIKLFNDGWDGAIHWVHAVRDGRQTAQGNRMYTELLEASLRETESF
jgi:hypothetical protein